MGDATGFSWTQPICEADWIAREGVFSGKTLVEVRAPVRVLTDAVDIETCAFCGRPTIFGVYVREDPRAKTVMLPAARDD